MNQETKGDKLPPLRRYKGICKWQRPRSRTSVKQVLHNKSYNFRHCLSPVFIKLALKSLSGVKKDEKVIAGSQR